MLKAVIQNVKLRLKLVLGDQPSFVTAFPDYDRNVQPARNQQRFVAEIGSAAIRIHYTNATRLAAISTRQNIETNATRLQQFAERNYEWRFARASHR